MIGWQNDLSTECNPCWHEFGALFVLIHQDFDDRIQIVRTGIPIRSYWVQFIAIIKLGRLHFLTSGVLLNFLGTAVAIYAGASFKLSLFLLGQVVITSTQLMTHYANEYYDLDADIANQTPTQWSGGSRVLVEGGLSPDVALKIAVGWASFALIGNIILTLTVSPHIVTATLFTSALALSWFYSAPPLQLHSTGFGELSATLTVSTLTPITAYFLQAHTIDLLILLAVVPLCFLQFAMLISIEFPDEAGDRVVGKNTLVVRLRPRRAVMIYAGALIAAFASLPLIVIFGFPIEVALLQLLPFPLALMLLWNIKRGDWHRPEKWNGLGFYSIVLLMSMIALEFIGFVLLIGMR